MSTYSPMSYFATQEQSNQGDLSFEGALKHHENILRNIDTIIGLSDVKKKLMQWNNKHCALLMKKEAGLEISSYLPEILIASGRGSRSVALDHVGRYLMDSEFVETAKVTYHDINDFVMHYVCDSKQAIQNAFDSDEVGLICFYGFDTLVANPRPTIADWHDWVDIIFNYILDSIDKSAYGHPTSLSMSSRTFKKLLEKFPRLKNFTIEKIQCHYATAKELAMICTKKLCDKGYLISEGTNNKIFLLIQNCLNNEDYKKINEPTLRDKIIMSILDRQAKRLYSVAGIVSKKFEVKSIKETDVPVQAIFLKGQVIFY